MKKIKALIIVVICTIALGGGVITVSNAQASQTKIISGMLPASQAGTVSGMSGKVTTYNIQDSMTDDPSTNPINNAWDETGIILVDNSSKHLTYEGPWTDEGTYITVRCDTGVTCTYDTSNPLKFTYHNMGIIKDESDVIDPVKYVDVEFTVDNITSASTSTSTPVRLLSVFYYPSGLKSNQIQHQNVNVDFSVKITYSDDFTYTNSGQPVSNTNINLIWTDMDYLTKITFDKSSLSQLVVPMCLARPTGTASRNNPCYYMYYDNLITDSAIALTNDQYYFSEYTSDVKNERIRVIDGGSTISIFDFWNFGTVEYNATPDISSVVMGSPGFEFVDLAGSGTEKTNIQNTPEQNFQSVIQTDTNGQFSLSLGQALEVSDTLTNAGGNNIYIESPKLPVLISDKKYYDAGVGYDDTTTPETLGDGANDNYIAPAEDIIYTIAISNYGSEAETGYTIQDALPAEVALDTTSLKFFKVETSEYALYKSVNGDIVEPYGLLCTTLSSGCTDVDSANWTNSSTASQVNVTLNEAIAENTTYLLQFKVSTKLDFGLEVDGSIDNTADICSSTSVCESTPEIKVPYGSISIGITKLVNDDVDATYNPTTGLKPNGDTYASSEEWLNYTIEVTNASARGATVPAQDVEVIDNITLDTGLSELDATTIKVKSSIDGDITSACDTSLTTSTKIDIKIPTINVDEKITITFKAKVA